jgi:hypothetical protein
MEELIVTQGPGYRTRPGAVRDAVTAYQTAAWRAPGQTRFDSRPANDFLSRAEVVAPTARRPEPIEAEPLPRWLIVAIGGVIAAVLGMLLGGALAV